VLELVPPAPIEVVVVPDTSPVLQALRAELRPARPEIDGILGIDALGGAVLDVDYPHNRVLMRCVPPAATCVADPAAPPACAVRPTPMRSIFWSGGKACQAAARCEGTAPIPRP